MATTHDEFYERAELYDIAFSFKDVPGECDFLQWDPKSTSGTLIELTE